MIGNDNPFEGQVLLLDALLRELVRSDVLTDEMCQRVAMRFKALEREYEGNDRQQFYAGLAVAAEMYPVTARARSASEYRADFMRRQMRERTTLYERRAREAEGGKDER